MGGSRIDTRRNGWVIVSPKGTIMLHTFAKSKLGAMRKLMSIAEGMYGPLVSSNFSRWQQVGYSCEWGCFYLKKYYEV